MIEKLCAQAFDAGAEKALSDFGLLGNTKTAGIFGDGNLHEGLAGLRKAFVTMEHDPHMTDMVMPELERHMAALSHHGDPLDLAAARGELDRIHALHGTPAPAPPVITPPPPPTPSHGLDRIRDMVRKNPLAIAGGLGAAGLGAGALGGYEAKPDDSMLDHLKFWG